MRKRNIAIIVGSLLAIALPVSAFVAVGFLSNVPKVSSSYIYKPDSNASIALQQQVSDALDVTIGEDGVLNLQFDTLTNESQYSASQNAWFSELSSAFKWIDPRLSFQRNPRNNALVERAHFNGDTMMRSFFWSADYKNVGTWIGYNFTDQFAITNLYPSLYQYSEDFRINPQDDKFITKQYGEINADGRPEVGNPFSREYQTANWLPDLSKQLATFLIPQDYIDGYNEAPDSEIKKEIPTLEGLAPKNGGVNGVPYFYSWQQLEQIDRAIQIGTELTGIKPGTLLVRDLMWNQIGYWSDIKTSSIESEQYWLGLVTWINQQRTAIPYISGAGSETTTITLATNGLHPVKNPNTDINFLNWFTDSNAGDKSSYTSWWESIPFNNTVTPYNPVFTRAPNAIFFQSTFNGLVDYKTKGDWVSDNTDSSNPTLTPPQVDFYLQGAKSIVLKDDAGVLLHTIGGKVNGDDATWLINPNDIAATSNATIYEFNIPIGDEAFDWIDSEKKVVGKVTAQDYFAGTLAFILSADWNYNSNGYYTSLFNMDIEETIKANKHFFSERPIAGDYRSMKTFTMVDTPIGPKANTFTLVQTSPNVNTLDILTKQYFQPLPSKNNGVKYIFEKNKEFLNDNPVSVNEQAPGYVENVYGGTIASGTDVSGWWSPGPYTVTSSNGTTDMVFEINPGYFNKFPPNFFREIGKQEIKTIVMKYGRGYSVQNVFEQFKAGETNISKIPQGNLPEVYGPVLRDSVRITGHDFLGRTDLLSFNTDIYKLDSYGIPSLDASGEKELKPFITKEYEQAIIADLYLGKEGNSYKIRSGIMELIDWYSLSSLATPTNTPYYQNSIVPFGNAPISRNNNGTITTTTFFNVSLNKGSIGYTSISYAQYQKNWQQQLG